MEFSVPLKEIGTIYHSYMTTHTYTQLHVIQPFKLKHQRRKYKHTDAFMLLFPLLLTYLIRSLSEHRN